MRAVRKLLSCSVYKVQIFSMVRRGDDDLPIIKKRISNELFID